jgi:maltose O-acetyltransferase
MNIVGTIANVFAVLRARLVFRRATSIGTRVRLWGKAFVNQSSGTFQIGRQVRLIGTITPLEFGVGPQGKLIIGDRTYINYGCSIAALESVEIGRDCLLGTYVMIMDNDFHRLEPERRLELPPSAPIKIGDNVWLGARTIVLKGVTIGDGCVVAAGSLVTKSLPPRVLAAGTPAKVLRTL